MKKTNLRNYLKTGLLGFTTPFLLWNCEIENVDTLKGRQNTVETVAVNEAVDFFNIKASSDPAKPTNPIYAIPHLDHISQEEIINSDALLTVIPATTVHSAHYSRILLLKINNKIQSIVFSMYASDDATHEQFSGEIIIMDLEGNFLNGYRVFNGEFVAQFRKTDMNNNTSGAAKTSGAVCPDHGECVEGSNCIVCLQELEEVVVTGDSGNNGGPMPFIDLNDFPGIDEGGDNGSDMGTGWDYGPGEGMAPEDEEENVEDQIVIDTTFVNIDKINCTYRQLLKNTTIKELLDHFFGDDADYDLIFEVTTNLDCSSDGDIDQGCTTDNLESNGAITIRVDKDYINSEQTPTLFLAQTIIHEAIHANLYLALYNHNNGNTVNLPDIDDFPAIYEQYRQIRGWQHEFMANHYVSLMAQTLQEVHPLLNDQAFINILNNNYPDLSLEEFYTNIAYLGLDGTAGQTDYLSNQKNNDNYNISFYVAQANSTKTPNCD